MRKLYLIGAIIVFLLILVLALPQIGASCTWYLISTSAQPTLVIFQAAGLGAVLGGLLVLWWKVPKEGGGNDSDSEEEEKDA